VAAGGEVTVNGPQQQEIREAAADDTATRTPIFVRGIVKRFGAVTAAAGVDLEVGEGEIVALLGPNGAGKSTLLRILSTTVLPDEGTALLAGHRVDVDPAAVRRSIGVSLSEERSWYYRLSGRQNMEFFGALHGLSKPDARRRADELLEDVGLADAADRRFDGYSAGMRARLSLARTLLVDPPVLLLDEPTRALDPLAALDFRRRAMELASDGKAILFATHDLHEAAAVANRVVLLARGRVAAVKAAGEDAAALERALQEVAQ